MSIARVNFMAETPLPLHPEEPPPLNHLELVESGSPTFGDARVLPPLTVGSSIATPLAAERSG
jgi:hypothetical protein